MKFVNKNNAFEKSQKYHEERSSRDFGGPYGSNVNIGLDEYHQKVYFWQKKNNVIMPKKMRKAVFNKIIKDYME